MMQFYNHLGKPVTVTLPPQPEWAQEPEPPRVAWQGQPERRDPQYSVGSVGVRPMLSRITDK